MTVHRKDQGKSDGASRRLWRDRGANTVVEFALVAPVLAYVLLAASDLGLATWQKAQVGNAARAGAQYAAAHGWNSPGITGAAQSATNLTVSVTPSTYCGCAGNGAIAQQTCGTSCSGGGTAATYVSVATQKNYTPISPVLWGQDMTTLSATSVARTN
jgi:Flp pilus assembly protein TadG